MSKIRSWFFFPRITLFLVTARQGDPFRSEDWPRVCDVEAEDGQYDKSRTYLRQRRRI